MPDRIRRELGDEGKRPTIKEVAAHAGVSKATVSLVLRDSAQIPPATKRRVRESMAAVGYVYNRHAAEMRSLRSRTIGLIVANVRNPYFAELTMAVEERAHASGHTLILGCSADDVRRQDELLRAMGEQRVDGIALLPANFTTPADLRKVLDDTGMPHVLVARSVPGYTSNYVGADNVAAGRILGTHLRSRGVRRVAFIGGVAGSIPREDRARGLLAGLEPDVPALVADAPSEHDAIFEASGVLDSVLSTGPQPEAIVGYNDMYAIGLHAGLRARGFEPGVDVLVAGFDNVPQAATQYPGLTTVDGFPARVGLNATEMLLSAMAESADPTPRQELIDPVLWVRASTGAPGTVT